MQSTMLPCVKAGAHEPRRLRADHAKHLATQCAAERAFALRVTRVAESSAGAQLSARRDAFTRWPTRLAREGVTERRENSPQMLMPCSITAGNFDGTRDVSSNCHLGCLFKTVAKGCRSLAGVPTASQARRSGTR
jgi:hypothetical protein